MNADELMELAGGYWEEDSRVPVSDWQNDVANNDTRLGYWQFVEARLEGVG